MWFACHGLEGTGVPAAGAPPGTSLAPPLAGAKLVLGNHDQSIMVLLHGLTGPVDGKTYPITQMIPMATNSDQWIAAVLSYVRVSFGNQAPFITTADVTRVRATTANITAPPTVEQIEAFAPNPPGKEHH
jgi:mono/diheme cytochrome c family protein